MYTFHNCFNYNLRRHFCLARPWLVHARLDLLFTPTIVRESVTNYMMSLHDLERIDARRTLQQMAVVLCRWILLLG